MMLLLAKRLDRRRGSNGLRNYKSPVRWGSAVSPAVVSKAGDDGYRWHWPLAGFIWRRGLSDEFTAFSNWVLTDFFFFCVDQVRLIGYDSFFLGGVVFVGWWQGGWRWWRWMGFRLWWFLFGLGIQIENDGSEEFCFVCDLRDCFKSTESCLWYQIWHRATKTIFPGK